MIAERLYKKGNAFNARSLFKMRVLQGIHNPNNFEMILIGPPCTLRPQEVRKSPLKAHWGKKSTFYPEISKNLVFEKCEFCEK